MPMLPVISLASSDRMSPNMFSVTITSNWAGSLQICMAQLSRAVSKPMRPIRSISCSE
ncbi:Uncharacterised protein [uncultured Blautia sp.]|nr:Uncharacterised protein [uncultured Blautia sp.]